MPEKLVKFSNSQSRIGVDVAAEERAERSIFCEMGDNILKDAIDLINGLFETENLQFVRGGRREMERTMEQESYIQGNTHTFTCSEEPSTSSEIQLVDRENDRRNDPQWIDRFVNYTYAHRSELFKTKYPICIEGIVLRSIDEEGKIDIFSSRIGKITMADPEYRMAAGYVYLVMFGPSDFTIHSFDMQPTCLTISKYVKSTIEIRGYALIGFASGKLEEEWIVWNDSAGIMRVISGAARLSKKKCSSWEPTLDVISFIARFERSRFVVHKIVHLTNLSEKLEHMPENVFLVSDLMYKCSENGRYVFFSNVLKNKAFMRQNDASQHISNGKMYKGIICPAFVMPMTLEYTILAIEEEATWNGTFHDNLRRKLEANFKTAFVPDTNNVNLMQSIYDQTSDGNPLLPTKIKLPPKTNNMRKT